MNQVKLREDLEVSLIQEANNHFIYINDPLLIAEPIGLPFSYYPFIQLLMEGKMTATEIAADSAAEQIRLSEEKVHVLLSNMEELSLLETERTRIAIENMKSYVAGNLRNSYCHSFSYPDTALELDRFLDQILSSGEEKPKVQLKGLLAPHIDLRIEEAWSVYANSFLPLKNASEIDTLILLGTAHYKSSADFMFTKKDFVTPYGTAQTDMELLTAIQESVEIHFDDIAHYKEHSLEFHLLFAQKLLPNKNFKILPILTGSPFNYVEDGLTPDTNESYVAQINAIKKAVETTGKKVLILASGDMSHVGRKFGDDFPAGTEVIRINTEDKLIIGNLKTRDKNNFFNQIIEFGDRNRMCGVAPFYAALSLIDRKKTVNVGYDMWLEDETESLVSFAGFTIE
jgi:AmmeMemoRadiSam system protein B